MKTVVPTLGLGGFVRDLPAAIDKIFSYYLTTDKSQSNLFSGSVFSLQSQIQAYQHDTNQLVSNVRDELRSLMLTVADEASVDVRADLPSPIDPNRINLTIIAHVTSGGETKSLGRLIEAYNGQVRKIMDYNNNGGEL